MLDRHRNLLRPPEQKASRTACLIAIESDGRERRRAVYRRFLRLAFFALAFFAGLVAGSLTTTSPET